jgi:hypothetical protein
MRTPRLPPRSKVFSPTSEFPEIEEAQKLLATLVETDEVENAAASRQCRLKLQTSYGQALFWVQRLCCRGNKGRFYPRPRTRYWNWRYGRTIPNLLWLVGRRPAAWRIGIRATDREDLSGRREAGRSLDRDSGCDSQSGLDVFVPMRTQQGRRKSRRGAEN